MRRAVLLAAIVATVGGATAASAGVIAPSMTVNVSPQPVLLDHSSTVKGRLNNGKSGVKLDLRVTRFPFSGPFHTIATTTSGSSGGYVFHFSPRLATRVQVQKHGNANVRSPVATAYVIADFSHTSCTITPPAPKQSCASPKGSGPLTVHLRYHRIYPSAAFTKERTKAVYVYFGLRQGTQPPQTLTLRKTVPQQDIGSDTTAVSASWTFQPPKNKYTYQIATCIKFTEAADGLGLPSHHHCGDQTVTHKQASNSTTFG